MGAETTVSAMEHWLTTAAGRHPEGEALLGCTYRELLDGARRAAGGLRERGVGAGDRVALALAADAGFAAALHGCFLAGAVAVPIDLRLSAEEQERRIAGAEVIDGALDGPPLEDETPLRLAATATLMHTSGTTARPRPVTLSYGNWLANALGSAVGLGLDQRERWLCPMPLAHVGGLSILIRSTIYGTTAVVHERFDTERVLGELMSTQRRITLVSLVPTMLARLLDAGLREPPTLRWALLGGGPIVPSLLERADAAGVPVAPTYGMTEACSQIATSGWPLPGVELRIAHDGEVLVRGENVSADALRADGWLHTGDLGSLDEGGRLRIIGRKADTIVTGGENVAPTEIESVLLEHPAVADAGVFARPDEEWGEAIVAAVVLRPDASVSDQELREHCAHRLARFKVPKRIEFTERLPRTHSGKLIRQALR
jgi:o-succinylbenzoate---CoA ligase